MGTYNVLAASAKNNVKRVILASSSSIYGDIREAARESMIEETYQDLYPLSKRIGEVTAALFNNFKLETVTLRYFSTYGNGENSKGEYSSVIWKFIESIRNGKKPVIYGDGTQSRDFIYVKDAARASILAMKNGRAGDVYNVGTGVSTDYNKIFDIIKGETNYDGTAEYVPTSIKNYRQFTHADLSHTKDQLNFIPEFHLMTGIRETINALMEK